MKTVEETKKTKEDQVELKNEVKENTAETQEGAVTDESVETVSGGFKYTRVQDLPRPTKDTYR